jgi:fucose 4-O-acetylase-like acetyltransferase
MKAFRILAIIPLTLMSLMNVGYVLPTDPKHDVAVAVAVLVLGLAGLGAVYGLARSTRWGVPAALAVAALNVAAAIIALANDAEGAMIGLVVSAFALALALALAANAGARKTQVA